MFAPQQTSEQYAINYRVWRVGSRSKDYEENGLISCLCTTLHILEKSEANFIRLNTINIKHWQQFYFSKV